MFRAMRGILTFVTRGMVLLALSVAAGPVRAQSVVSSGESFVDMRLFPGRAESDGSRLVALVIDVAPGWKTYWRNPGAAGIPPSFDWSASRNLRAAEVMWPRPVRFDSFGLSTLGYGGQVVFPVRLDPEDRAAPLDISVGVALGVCRDICVLEEATVGTVIAPDAPEIGGALLRAAEALVPRPGAAQGLRTVSCRLTGAGAKRAFEATLDFDNPPLSPEVILEGPEQTWFTASETTTDDAGAITVRADLSLLDGSSWLDRSDIRMTVLANDFAADIVGCSASGS